MKTPIRFIGVLALTATATANTFTFATRGAGPTDNLQTVWISSDAADTLPDGANHRLNDWAVIHKPTGGAEHQFLSQFNLAALKQAAAGYSSTTVTRVRLVGAKQWGGWCSISLFEAGAFTPATTTWNTAAALQGSYRGDLGGDGNGNWTWDSANPGTQPWETPMRDLVTTVQTVLSGSGSLANFLMRVNNGNEWSNMTGWGSPSLIVDVDFGTPLDTDGDGLLDTWELAYFPSIETWGGADDPDADGSTNLAEQTRTTLPNDSDTDHDGLLDGAETNTDTWVSSSNTGTDPLDSDSDDDGLLDGVEDNGGTLVSASQTGTNPNDDDSDNDALTDGAEVLTWNTNPLANADKDGDTLSDANEVLVHLTNPSLPDTDGDTFNDNAEITAGTNPNWAADTFEWRPGGLVGGSGLWETVLTNWHDGHPAIPTPTTWSAGHSARFPGTLTAAATVDLSAGGITGVKRLVFTHGGSDYTLTNGSIAFNDTTARITVGAGSAVINTPLSAASGLILDSSTSAAGTIVLGADNSGSLSGITTINGGGLRLANSTALGGCSSVVLQNNANQLALGAEGMAPGLPLAIGAIQGRVGEGALHYSLATGQATWAGDITLTGAPASGGHFGSAGGGLVLSGVVTSASQPVRVRSGVVRFDNPANSFSQLYLHQGSVLLGADNALPTTASFVLGDNNFAATLDLNGFNQTLASLTRTTGTGSSTVAGSGLLTLDLAASNTFAGSFGGAASVLKKGVGELVIAGTSNTSGDVTVETGTLRITTNQPQFGAFTGSGRVIAKTGASIVAAADNCLHGWGNGGVEYVVEAGAILTTADHVTTHLTRVTLQGGELASGAPSALYGSYDLGLNSPTLSRIIADGGAVTSVISAQDLRLSIATGSVFEARAGSAPGGIDLDVTGTLTGAHGLRKEGAGQMRLGNAVHGYYGNTVVAEGTLRVLGTIPNSPRVEVATGAGMDVSPGYAFATSQTLAGSGTVTGGISGAGTIAPGTSIGQLTVAGNADLTGTSLAIEIDETQTPANDTLAVSGALDLDGSVLAVTITGTPTQESYLIATYGSLSGTFSSHTGIPSGYELDYAFNGGTAVALKKSTSPYLLWVEFYHLDPAGNGAPGADPDSDGLDNLAEFALASSPIDGQSRPALTVAADGATLSLSYRRAKAATDVSFIAEWSTNLVDWSTPGLTDLPTGIEDATTTEYRATIAKDGATGKFLRIRVAGPSSP